LDHRLELLSDGRFDGIRTKPYRGCTEQRRVFDDSWPGNHDVTYPEVDLDIQPHVAHASFNQNPGSSIRCVLCDLLSADALRIEFDRVRIDLDRRQSRTSSVRLS